MRNNFPASAHFLWDNDSDGYMGTGDPWAGREWMGHRVQCPDSRGYYIT